MVQHPSEAGIALPDTHVQQSTRPVSTGGVSASAPGWRPRSHPAPPGVPEGREGLGHGLKPPAPVPGGDQATTPSAPADALSVAGYTNVRTDSRSTTTSPTGVRFVRYAQWYQLTGPLAGSTGFTQPASSWSVPQGVRGGAAGTGLAGSRRGPVPFGSQLGNKSAKPKKGACHGPDCDWDSPRARAARQRARGRVAMAADGGAGLRKLARERGELPGPSVGAPGEGTGAGLHAQAEALRACQRMEWAWDKGPAVAAGHAHPVVRAPLLLVGTGKPAMRAMSCKHRLCPDCARDRATRLRQQLEGPVMELFESRKPAMITLTMDDVPDAELGAELDRIYEAFRKLRRRAAWKESGDQVLLWTQGPLQEGHHREAIWVDNPTPSHKDRRRILGGIAALEVTRNQAERTWHVHLHVLVDLLDLFPQAELLHEWRACLGRGAHKGGARVERVRASGSRSGLGEVLKYVTKGLQVSTLPQALLSEMLRALHGRRMLATFGSMYRLKLSEDDDEETPVQDDTVAWAVNAVTGEPVLQDRASWRHDAEADVVGWRLLRGGALDPDGALGVEVKSEADTRRDRSGAGPPGAPAGQ